jgi:hypothetical protein
MLSERLAVLLDQSIEEYIKTAVPVASTVISARMQRARSPATIRNDLKILEELGFLHQVHAASGGRIPTARAYAEYVQRARDPTFASDLIYDLAQLSAIVERIERKLGGIGGMPLTRSNPHDEMVRKINFQKLFNDYQTQMSAIYLIIKEKIDNGEM